MIAPWKSYSCLSQTPIWCSLNMNYVKKNIFAKQHVRQHWDMSLKSNHNTTTRSSHTPTSISKLLHSHIHFQLSKLLHSNIYVQAPTLPYLKICLSDVIWSNLIWVQCWDAHLFIILSFFHFCLDINAKWSNQIREQGWATWKFQTSQSGSFQFSREALYCNIALAMENPQYIPLDLTNILKYILKTT